MKVLILGGQGMLGHRLWVNLQAEHEIWVTVRQDFNPFPTLPHYNRERVVLGVNADNFNQITDTLDKIGPDLVINCIGIIKQRKEESQNPVQTIAINSLLPHQISQACEKAKIRMVQISTDCVFSGKRGNYTEEDDSDAGDLYGRSKYLGEVTELSHCITLRTSIIGHELQTRLGLVEWFLNHRDGECVNGYKNAIFSGFTTDELSRLINDFVLPRPELSGLYQVSSDPISKYDLLSLINSFYQRKIIINPDEQFKIDRSLNSSHFRRETGYSPPSWPAMVQGMANGSKQYEKLVH